MIEEFLIEYAKKTIEKGTLYFIADNSLEDDCFVVYEYEENDDNVLKISKEELPEDLSINNVLRKENNKYVFDEEDTNAVALEISKMFEEILEEQKEVLESYRKEEHLYKVTEKINDRIFLQDITEGSEEEIEEVDFPIELLEDAWEGNIFKYIDGEYKKEE